MKLSLTQCVLTGYTLSWALILFYGGIASRDSRVRFDALLATWLSARPYVRLAAARHFIRPKLMGQRVDLGGRGALPVTVTSRRDAELPMTLRFALMGIEGVELSFLGQQSAIIRCYCTSSV